MGNACRICYTPKKKTISLSKKTSNGMQLKLEGKEFEYCFGLKVLEVPKYTRICVQCQQQLHNFYLFKRKAIKSQYRLLRQVRKIKKKTKPKLLKQSENIKNLESNSENDYTDNESIKIELDEYDENQDDQLQEIEKMSVKVFAESLKRNTTDGINDNSKTNGVNEIKLETDIITEYEDSSEDSVEDIFEQKMAEEDAKRKLKYKNKKKKKVKGKNVPITKLNCELCGKNFHIQETYDAHMNTHKGLPEYSCEICGKHFKSRHKMCTHIKCHKNQRDFACGICSKAFVTKFNLSTHMKLHTDEKEFICDECGKLFRTKVNLNEHKETHSIEKHECSICHAKLNTKGTLKCHMRGVHGLYDNPNIFCTICQKQFIKKNYYTAHMAKKHPEIQTN